MEDIIHHSMIQMMTAEVEVEAAEHTQTIVADKPVEIVTQTRILQVIQSIAEPVIQVAKK